MAFRRCSLIAVSPDVPEDRYESIADVEDLGLEHVLEVDRTEFLRD